MSKIGTAHVEVKPVVDETALAFLGERIEAIVEKAVRSGLARGIAHLAEGGPDA